MLYAIIFTGFIKNAIAYVYYHYSKLKGFVNYI